MYSFVGHCFRIIFTFSEKLVILKSEQEGGVNMGVYKEIVAVCDLCAKKERFDEAKNVNEAQGVASQRGWFLKKKGATVDFVICPRCRNEIK